MKIAQTFTQWATPFFSSTEIHQVSRKKHIAFLGQSATFEELSWAMDKAPAGLLGAGEEASEPGRFGCWDSFNSPKCIQEKAKGNEWN